MFANTRAVLSAGCLAVLLGLPSSLRASQSASGYHLMGSGEDVLHLEDTKWEVGLHVGQMRPVGNITISIQASNAAFLVSDPGQLGEDEFSENGITPPDFSGSTLVTGDLEKSYAIGLHVYRKTLPWLAVGGEFLYMFGGSLPITAGGPFVTPIYDTTYSIHGFQTVVSARIGDWIGPIRPYAMAGVGPYLLTQTVSSELNDPDDPDHPPVVAASRSDGYFSVLYGGGLDVKFFNEGSIGAGIFMQQAFIPGNDLKFVMPVLRFTYHF